jgi:hypothetical protein
VGTRLACIVFFPFFPVFLNLALDKFLSSNHSSPARGKWTLLLAL